MKRFAVVSSLMIAALAFAPTALAVPAPVVLTSEQLTTAGFPVTPNTTGWGQPVTLSAQTAPVWADVVVRGKAPDTAAVGQLLTMQRWYPKNAKGDGEFAPLNITAIVAADHSFVMHFQLGYPGTWGYRVGYSTAGTSPEFVGFQFQFTTTGKAKPAPAAIDQAVLLNSKQLSKAGFTKKPNVVGWGGTAAITRHKAPAGAPITISGKAPSQLVAGTVLTLERFVATDKQGSGSFMAMPIVTTVRADGSFALTFELNEPGVFGYSLGAPSGEEWVGIEFQVKTT